MNSTAGVQTERSGGLDFVAPERESVEIRAVSNGLTGLTYRPSEG